MKKSLIAVLLLASGSLFAGVETDIILDKEVVNTNCEQTDSCSLKTFGIQISDYIVTMKGEKSYGTSATMSYGTEKINQIEDYAIVQFIRGCVYNEKLDKDGKRVKRRGISRKFFDSYKNFIHPEWVIDSIDKDPIYNSSDMSESRHQYYRWNEDPNSFSEEGEHYILRRSPAHPKVYVSDLPSASYLFDSEAKNTNLEFKACIYKTKDVPRELGPSDIDFAEPLHCLDWKTSNVYNFDTKKYEQDVSIEESCGDL